MKFLSKLNSFHGHWKIIPMRGGALTHLYNDKSIHQKPIIYSDINRRGNKLLTVIHILSFGIGFIFLFSPDACAVLAIANFQIFDKRNVYDLCLRLDFDWSHPTLGFSSSGHFDSLLHLLRWTPQLNIFSRQLLHCIGFCNSWKKTNCAWADSL